MNILITKESTSIDSLPLKDKIALVTGANQGLGYGYSIRLASLGATVIMLCRDESKGITSKTKIIDKTKNSNVFLELCDLASLDSINQFLDRFKSKYLTLDILVNNAGVYQKNRSETADGFETTIGVNYFAHFYLTYSLISLLENSPSSTVLNITSNFGQRKGKINLEDLNKKNNFSGMEAYNQSKLAIVISTLNFSKHYADTNISFYSVCPGVVRTNIIRDFKLARIGWKIIAPFIQSPEKGAETGIKLITKDIRPVNGEKFFRKSKPLLSNPESYEPTLQNALWEFSIQNLKLGKNY